MRPRTFTIGRLYFQFLEPKQIPIERLGTLVLRLHEAGFIDLFESSEPLGGERYTETAKLTGREHRDELFSIIQTLKESAV